MSIVWINIYRHVSVQNIFSGRNSMPPPPLSGYHNEDKEEGHGEVKEKTTTGIDNKERKKGGGKEKEYTKRIQYKIKYNKPSSLDRVTIKLDKKIYDKIAQKVGMGEIRKYVNDTVLLKLERSELLKIYKNPFLYLVYIEGQSLFLKDNNLGKVVEVKLVPTNGKGGGGGGIFILQCQEDKQNSDSCVHVAFCLALPDLGQLNINRKQKEQQLKG